MSMISAVTGRVMRRNFLTKARFLGGKAGEVRWKGRIARAVSRPPAKGYKFFPWQPLSGSVAAVRLPRPPHL